jgi:ParB family chromosome partitioning protein
MGHARALITLEDPEMQMECARQVIHRGLSVRNVEKLIQKLKAAPLEKGGPVLDPDLQAVQEELLKILGTKVSIAGKPEKGVIRIHYFSLDDLNRIYETLKGADA